MPAAVAFLIAFILMPGSSSFAADAGTAGASTPAVASPKPSTRPAGIADPQAVVVRFLEDRVHRDPDDITAQNRLSGEYLKRFRRSGDDRDLTLASAAATQSLKSVPAEGNTGGLAARARAAFALHGFTSARDDGLELVQWESGKRFPYEILGDASLEIGDLDAAAEAYRKMESFDDADVNSETRMARLAWARGDVAAARKRYDAAVEMATALDPPAPDIVAWCCVQSGQAAFSTGDWESAERRYAEALRASPTDWAAIDHLAELRAAQKKYDEAIGLYEPLVGRVPRPELFQSLGDVCALGGRADEAKRWHAKAIEKYLAGAAEGSAHYYHHIAGFYSDTESNPAEAVKWAKKDLEIRRTAYAYDGLAWALYQAGEWKPAAAKMDKALAAGTRDSHILYHASLIYIRAGDSVKARDCLARAGQMNSKFTEFHVHR